jgi:hypothetical protein
MYQTNRHALIMGMNRLAISALAFGLLPVAAACGGGSGTGHAYADAASVAKAAGFTNCTADPNVISTDAVSCDEGRVNWFSSAKAQDSWSSVASAVGSLGGPILNGSRWAVECDTVSSCNAAKSKLGGELE